MQTGYPPIRRVLTGHDEAHVAKVLLDEPATNAKHPQPGLVSTLMWCTEGAPAAVPIGERPEDMGARILGTAPPRSGTRFASRSERESAKRSATHRGESNTGTDSMSSSRSPTPAKRAHSRDLGGTMAAPRALYSPKLTSTSAQGCKSPAVTGGEWPTAWGSLRCNTICRAFIARISPRAAPVVCWGMAV